MITDASGVVAGTDVTVLGSDDGHSFWRVAGAFTDRAAGKLAIDFSPKGGPAGLEATWANGQLAFGDGNSWQQVDASFKPVHDQSGKKAEEGHEYRALFVVGSELGVPLSGDLVFKERLESQGFSVTLIKDSAVTNSDCEAHDVMLVSASISGGLLGKKVNDCTTPQLIWEVGLYNANAMAGPSLQDAWVTSPYWNKYHQDAWLDDGYWPAAPTGADICITEDAENATLAAGFGAGCVPMFSVADYGQNWVNVKSLGKGAKVVATLPPQKTLDWNKKSTPGEHKAVLFYYEKGAELWAAAGGQSAKSPALRIAFPPYHFIYGSAPTCEELDNVPTCADCRAPPGCLKAADAKDVENPMPLSSEGLKMLDAAIDMLKKEARKGLEDGA